MQPLKTSPPAVPYATGTTIRSRMTRSNDDLMTDLLICVIVANELPVIQRGQPVKDAIVLANQYLAGEKAGVLR